MAKTGARILVVDDDPDIAESARVVLRQHFTEVITEANPQQIKFLLNENSYDAVLLDMNYTTGVTKGSEGLFWLREILADFPTISTVMITAYGEVKLAVEAMKIGAVDFIVKPWQNERLIATVMSAVQLARSKKELDKLRTRQARLSEVYNSYDPVIIGESPAMKEVFEMVKRVAATDANVLITGENGTGKELIAKSIHQQSLRKSGPFVKVDVGALTETLFAAELFGHKKGAFTDAHQDRIGRFELASEGTLFLDEIGNLQASLQAKLLTALQNRVILPLGSNREIPINIRLVSATNQPVSSMIADGKFREDLLYRLNTVELYLPPLRDRPEDIPVLLDHFVELYTRKYNKPIKADDRLARHLVKYKWPGNVREFQHAIERSVILCEGDMLKSKDFKAPEWSVPVSATATRLSEVERKAIADAIRKNGGNLTKAARDLGLGRTTLYRKIERYGL
jgi:DNA-binding NtrC family response regulator